ncbi:hypothetical protein [Shinella pollutisoli]|uniref:Uncharacterized protein n=1 Tax=Shinella pollutisoli TaxID=2250594 RepID=A0ABV7DMX2_9HYPH|nr:hypothetical protein [Shinella pollutisoli]
MIETRGSEKAARHGGCYVGVLPQHDERREKMPFWCIGESPLRCGWTMTAAAGGTPKGSDERIAAAGAKLVETTQQRKNAVADEQGKIAAAVRR